MAGGRPVWLGLVDDPDGTADIAAWVESGGPNVTEPPGVLDLYSFSPSRRVRVEIDELVALSPAPDRMCPLKTGDELFIGAPDGKIDEKLEFTFEIAFNEPLIFDAAPILETLKNMIDLVDSLLPTFDHLL